MGERDRESLSLFARRDESHARTARLVTGGTRRQRRVQRIPIAMVETYQRAPTRTLALALDKAFGAPRTFQRLEARLRNLPFPASFRPFATYEAEATALRWSEHSLVPGLLQTEEYARAVLSTRPNPTDADIDELVSGHMERQAVLTREEPPPPLLWVLPDEGVLHRPVAPPSVMHDQLLHLNEASRLPNVTVNVVTYAAGGHSGLLGTFIIAELDGSPRIVFMEDVSGGRVTEDPSVVSEVGLRFDALRSETLPTGASRDLIAKVATEKWKA